MAKKLDKEVKKQCNKKNLNEEQCNTYFFGGLRNSGGIAKKKAKPKK